MGKLSREKGKRGERMFAEICRKHGYTKARRSVQYCGKAGTAADVVGLPGIHVEVKNVENLNVRKALEQAEEDNQAAGGKKLPLVAWKKNRQKWVAVMDLEDWFKIYAKWEEGTGSVQ